MEVALKDSLGYTVFCEQIELYNFFKKIFLFNNDILLVRLYKNYVRRCNVEATLKSLKSIELSNNLDVKEKKTLASLISVFKDSSETSEYSFQKHRDWGYDPVHLIISDEPYSTLGRNIPLEDYDNNDGEPFWMRPKYILDHYSKSNKCI